MTVTTLRRFFVFATVASTTFFAFVPSAVAAVTSSVDGSGVLTVASDDASDTIKVTCSATGRVKVNGARPDSGVANCADITSIIVTAGGGHDSIELEHVSPADFTSLSSVSIDAGDGSDSIRGSGVPDTIAGGNMNDFIRADPDLGDGVNGGSGSDQLTTKAEGDVAFSDISFTGSSGMVALSGVEWLLIRGGDAAQTIDGRRFTGELSLGGKGGDDELRGGLGPNRLNGGEGNNVIVGGPRRDTLVAGSGDDAILARGGNDVIYASAGHDVYRAGTDNDFFTSPVGRRDVLIGGPGRDSITAEVQRRATLTSRRLAVGAALARLRSVDRAKLKSREDANAVRIDAARFRGDAYLFGSYGDDALIGGRGDDKILAGHGSDTLIGGPGRDLLNGNSGFDMCDGGPGVDVLSHCEGT